MTKIAWMCVPQNVFIFIIRLVYVAIVFPIDLHDKYFPIFDTSYMVRRNCGICALIHVLVAAAETTNKPSLRMKMALFLQYFLLLLE